MPNGHSDWIHGWVDSTGSKIFTVHMVRDDTSGEPSWEVDDEDIWIRLVYLGSATAPLADWACSRKDCKSGKDYFSAATNVDASTESWTGLQASNIKRKLELTVTVNAIGPYMLRVETAQDNDSKGIYICPKVEVVNA